MSGIGAIVSTVESQSLNSVVTGFSFAAAIAWMDFVRWAIANVVKVNKTSGVFTFLGALITTLLAVLVYTGLNFLRPAQVNEPQQPMYAVVG
jgi:hypothetical protein